MRRIGLRDPSILAFAVGLSLVVGCTTRRPITFNDAPGAQSRDIAGASPNEVGLDAPLAAESRSNRDNCTWHLDFGLRVGYTKLASAKQKLDRRLDLPLRLDVLHVFHDPTTPIDRKTDLGLSTIYVGLGRAESDRLIWTAYLGLGGGRDDEHQRVLNLNLTTKFHYQTYYAGVTTEVYPWGRPRSGNDCDWAQRIRAGRPFLLTGLEVGYVNVHARGHLDVAPLRLYADDEKIRDWLFSGFIGAGWGLPLNERWSLNLATYCAFHVYRPEEYNTWNFVTTLRYALGAE